jgi:putative SOS response-associated peptidase YedK
MCSNFEPIKTHHANWVKDNLGCELPNSGWLSEIYPTYPSPFIYLENGSPKCDMAQFGLVPHWASDIKRFGLKTYNARSETVSEKASYRNAWKQQRFGFVLAESFFEPSWETGKAVRWRIKRADSQPLAIASIWERFIDRVTGEIVFSFSMLTVNATGHEVMKHFHKPADEKRSVVVLKDSQYLPWLNANSIEARSMLSLTPNGFLVSEAAPFPNHGKAQDLLI